MSELITLNVGGVEFTTTKTTLISLKDTFFDHMITYAGEGQTYFFIDRSPKHFNMILNHLRTTLCVCPCTSTDMRELIIECDFYRLEKYKEHVETFLWDQGHRKHSISQPFDIKNTNLINEFLKYIESHDMCVVDKYIFQDGNSLAGGANKVVFFIQRKCNKKISII